MRTLSDILLAIKPISIYGDIEIEVAGLTLDSRAVKADYVFAAIKGVSTDGHLFIPKAISLGATVILCEQPLEAQEGITVILVEDAAEALGCLASEFYDNPSHNIKLIGLITTLAADPDGKPCYALEGSIFIAGAAIQWLRDELGLIKTAAESEAAALSVSDTDGVYLVPAFTGLGAPHWDMEARGMLTGLTRGSNKNHIIRASLEAMAYQTYDVIQTMEKETGVNIRSLAVDGGATENNFLMQFQADILQIEVQRVQYVETTALGVAYLAGLGIGIWDKDTLKSFASQKTIFAPEISENQRVSLIEGWNAAIKQVVTR